LQEKQNIDRNYFEGKYKSNSDMWA